MYKEKILVGIKDLSNSLDMHNSEIINLIRKWASFIYLIMLDCVYLFKTSYLLIQI